MLYTIERLLLAAPRGALSRLRLLIYRALGLKAGKRNRFERVRCRRLSQIEIGSYNSLTDGCWLWPLDEPYNGFRIRIGDRNYFNRDVMIDACGLVEIGSENMFGPGVYITDSNHGTSHALSPSAQPMNRGTVRIGNRCWIGAGAIILKDVELGDGCVVGAGAVVTKSFPAQSTVAGVPAVPLQQRNPRPAEG